MEYTNVKNPVWSNAEKTAVNCEVIFPSVSQEYLPFTAVPEGDYDYTHQIFEDCKNGEYGEVGAYEPPPPYILTAEDNKAKATQLLFKTDWATIPDVSDKTMSNPYLSNLNEFLSFRNQVRQIVINPVAGDINWPTLPEAIWESV
jgi:hypothetical protein